MPCTLFLPLLVMFLACTQVSQNQLPKISTAPTWNIIDILASFLGDVGSLSCSYLGLPQSIRKPSKIQIQPVLDIGC